VCSTVWVDWVSARTLPARGRRARSSDEARIVVGLCFLDF
jgi:hypothetical protein